MFRRIPVFLLLSLLLLVLFVFQHAKSEETQEEENGALSSDQLYDENDDLDSHNDGAVVKEGSDDEDDENDDEEWWRHRNRPCPLLRRPRCGWGRRLMRFRYRRFNRWCYYYRCVAIRRPCPRVLIPRRCPLGTLRRRYRFRFFGRWCYRWRCVPQWVPLYRYWKPHGVDHFYTRNAREIGTTRPGTVGRYGYRSEGVACYVFATRQPGTVPLYRYWNARVTDHFYTTNAREIGTTVPGRVGRHGYKSEGIAGYCYPRPRRGLRPLYRYWKPRGSDHFYTTNRREIGTIQPGKVGRHGYRSEGVACYCK